MNRILLYIAYAASVVLAFAACTREAVLPEDGSKSPIELSVGVAETPQTKASVISDCDDATKKRAFTAETQLRLAIQSDNTAGSGHKHTMTLATAATVADKTNGVPNNGTKSAVSISPMRYWDDVFARDAHVSVYALAVADKASSSKFASTSWASATEEATAGETASAWKDGALAATGTGGLSLTWTIGKTESSKQVQDATTVADDDLCFSNNIANYSGQSSTDRRLKYNTEAGDKYHKFDKGDLIFYHALSKVSFEIYAGDGFTTDDGKVASSFSFPSSGNLKIKGFNGSGVFDVLDGKFSSVTQTDFEQIACSAADRSDKTKPVFTLTAYFVPGTDMTTTLNDAVSFVIYNNDYTVSMSDLYTALKDNAANVDAGEVKTTILDEHKYLKAGVHYKFSFRVAKSKMNNISAQILDWEEVSAAQVSPSNARISLSLEDRGTALGDGSTFDIYRALETSSSINDSYAGYAWKSGYTTDGKATKSYETDHWSTTWFWDSNRSFYHIRAVGDKSASTPASPTVVAESTNGDNFVLTHGESYHDYTWGAPFKDIDASAKLAYTVAQGFDGAYDGSDDATHQIYKGIGPTKDRIKLLMFHVMSDVTIKVQTTTGSDAVSLGDGTDANCTKIELKSIKTTGTALMGNGLVSATGDASDYSFTAHPAPNSGVISWANYGAIPQSLADVVLVITTPDHNQYKVKMKDIVAAATPSYNNVNYPAYTDNKVDRWYPGVKYVYSFKLSKTKIENITATIVDWETVNAGDDDVKIQ